MIRSFAVLMCLALAGSTMLSPVVGQILDEDNVYRRYGSTQVGHYRVGASITASRGAVQNIVAMVAVPFECDEQQVKIIEEDVTSHCRPLDYRLLREGGARQMLISIPFLPAGEKAHALVTFEVQTSTILPPEDTSLLQIPVKPDRRLKRYLGRSPYIETNHAKIKKVARQIFAELDENVSAWERVEAIYDYVLDHVEYVEGDDKSAVQTLNDAQGDCQNISALFIALCRTNKIPARIVWVHEHSFAEFCLFDQHGNPHWFPVESAGTRAFGEMPLARTILQKGDNFKVPERPRTPLRYASNFMIAEGAPGSGKPRVRYIQEQL
ncbi:MAG: transglutaminase-like domain-containing protein [Pirellulales bacterium]|nr:transglutaminase-like domain-containing protein [Pirellulales bacterium]